MNYTNLRPWCLRCGKTKSTKFFTIASKHIYTYCKHCFNNNITAVKEMTFKEYLVKQVMGS